MTKLSTHGICGMLNQTIAIEKCLRMKMVKTSFVQRTAQNMKFTNGIDF